jgi:hypothetical protein
MTNNRYPRVGKISDRPAMVQARSLSISSARPSFDRGVAMRLHSEQVIMTCLPSLLRE